MTDTTPATLAAVQQPEPTPAKPAASAFSLPNPQHLKRLPATLTAEQWSRIRQAAYQLPQVLSPNDLGDPASAALQLEKLGLIQIQKAVAGSRPSRWIAPVLIDVALAHLDAVAPPRRCGR